MKVVESSGDGSSDKPAEASSDQPAPEDEDGMKKMRNDFFANMSR